MIDLARDALPLIYLLWGLSACAVFATYSWPVARRVRKVFVEAEIMSEADWLRLGIVAVSASNAWIRMFWTPWYLALIIGDAELKQAVTALSWTLVLPAFAALAGYCCHLHARCSLNGARWVAPALFTASATAVVSWSASGGADRLAGRLEAFGELLRTLLVL